GNGDCHSADVSVQNSVRAASIAPANRLAPAVPEFAPAAPSPPPAAPELAPRPAPELAPGPAPRPAPAHAPGPATSRKRLPHATERFQKLLAVAELLATSFERADLYRVIVKAAADLSGADFVLLRAEDQGALRIVETVGVDHGTAGKLPAITTRDRSVESVLASGEPYVCNDVSKVPAGKWPDRFSGLLPVRGDLLIPLLHRGRLLGTLAVATRQPHRWSVGDVETLTALGSHAALALKNAELFDRLEERAARMAVVQAASARMNRATTVEAVGRAIVEEVGAIVDYHNARVYVVEPDGSVIPIAFEGKVGAYEIVDWSVLNTRVGEGFTGWVAQHGTPLNVGDSNADPRGVQIDGTDRVDESMLVVPLRHDGAVLGVVTLSKLGLNQFDDDDLQMLMVLADQAATALESARLLTTTNSMATELRRLLEMSQELSQTLDPLEVGSVIARHMATVLGADSAVISSWDAERDLTVSLGEYPHRGTVELHPSYELKEFPETRRVLETGATAIIDVDDPTADPSEASFLREEGFRSLVMVPLIAKGASIGLVEVLSRTGNPFDEARLAVARTMANEGAMALENARLYGAARALADRDPLTGFFNHRFLYERMGEEMLRARRTRAPLSLILLDVDDFKLVNDTFGHQLGDRCLVHLAEIIRSTLRASDIPARYGGDEFAVILPDADLDAALLVAQRISEHLAANPVVVEGRRPVPISVSIGAASVGTDVRTPAELVEAADARMYAAKLAAQVSTVESQPLEASVVGS
ncbi:MAG: diguanylate cyclase, partial [Chloroflexota bacterium]